MVKTKSEAWYAQGITKKDNNIIDAMDHIRLKEENINLPSPSKSLQGTLFYRDSINSAESIQSVKVEYDTARTTLDNTGNTKTKGEGIASHFIPKFLRSKSSLFSSNSNENIIRREPLHTTKLRQSTVDDFADTSSEDGVSVKQAYDAESINSILQEYEMNYSMYGSPTKKNDFIFREDFNDSSELNKSRISKSSRNISKSNSDIHTPSKVNSRNPSTKQNKRASIIELTLSDGSSHSSSGYSAQVYGFLDRTKTNGINSDGSSSPGFKIYEEKQADTQPERKKKIDRRKVISTSSNVDVFNRTSLSNFTTISDIDYSMNAGNRQSTSSILKANNSYNINRNSRGQSENRLLEASENILESDEETPIDPNVLERVLQTKRTSTLSGRFPNTSLIIMDETAIKNSTQNMTRSSMSTNELLNKLETFYDNNNNNNDNDTQESLPHPSISSKTNNFNAFERPVLTAGVDSKTNLPIMLYKVQDSHNTQPNWSQEERNLASSLSQKNKSSDFNSSIYPGSGNASMPILEPSKSRLGQYSSRNSFQNSTGGSSLHGDSFHSPISMNVAFKAPMRGGIYSSTNSSNSIASVKEITSNNYLKDTLSKNNSHEYMLPNTQPNSYNAVDSLPEDIEKGELNYPKSPPFVQPTHSWALFTLVIILGLVVPPVYLLLAIGFFDNADYRKNTLQLPYILVNPNQKKRFSRTQKLVSVVVGLLWVSIVLAMLGVGLGLGIKSEQ